MMKIPDPRWGDPVIARVIARDDDPWGVLSFLRGTAWEPLFPIVPFQAMEQALLGHVTPLMRVLGPPPSALAKRLPVVEAQCNHASSCLTHGPLCHPGPKVPGCWETPGFTPDQGPYVNRVVQLWKEGTVVVLVAPKVQAT